MPYGVGCSYQPTAQPLKEHLSSPPTSTPAPLSRYLLLAHDASRRLKRQDTQGQILSLSAPLHIPLITHRLKHDTPHPQSSRIASESAPHLLLADTWVAVGSIWLASMAHRDSPRSRPHATYYRLSSKVRCLSVSRASC
jgi:hypothetical protein